MSNPPSPAPAPLSQPASAQHMYDTRAPAYESSWHPSYSDRLTRLVAVQPGGRVLVLACGTGLESFLLAARGASFVVGVDVSEGMLALAQKRQEQEQEQGQEGLGEERVKFLKWDITDLDGCEELAAYSRFKCEGGGQGFDVVICSCAFVLLEDSARAVRGWRRWLRPGGRLVVDVPHERNMPANLALEKTAVAMGAPWPSNRRWVRGVDSFRRVLEAEGYVVAKIEVVDCVAGLEVTSYGVAEADEQFDRATDASSTRYVWEGRDMEKARELFRRAWEACAVDGRVEVVDALYVYFAQLA